MVIPIMHRRPNSRYRILFISLIVTFTLSMSLLINSEIITAIGYQMIESIAIVVIMLHFLVLFIFLFSRKIVEIGNLHLLENGFEIRMHSGTSLVFLKSIAKFRLIVDGYKGQSSDQSTGKKNDGLGNFLVVQTKENTVFYELLLNSELDMIRMLEYFRNSVYPGIIDIEYTSGVS
jgi:hypothetical protein